MAGLEQVRALAHPLRLKLLELFAEKPRTTKQAAEVMGEAPTKLYHHVATLERAGLIRLRETKQVRGTTEKYFEASAKRYLTDDPALADPDSQRDVAAMALLVFDQARNELVQALASGEERDDLMALRGVFHLSPTAAKKLRKELLDVLKKLHKARSRGKRKKYSVTIALMPGD